MSTAAVLLDIEKASDKTLQIALLHKLCNLKISASRIKLSSRLTSRKVVVSSPNEVNFFS
jgi:hypothetical protein